MSAMIGANGTVAYAAALVGGAGKQQQGNPQQQQQQQTANASKPTPGAYAAALVRNTQPKQPKPNSDNSNAVPPQPAAKVANDESSAKPPVRKRTGKSLADLVKQQDESGFVPPPEPARVPRKYSGNRNQQQPGFQQQYPQQGGFQQQPYQEGGFQQGAGWEMPNGSAEAGAPNLNWQQQELMRRGPGGQRGRGRQPGGAFSRGGGYQQDQQFAAFGGRQQQQPRRGYQQQGFQQQSAFGGRGGRNAPRVPDNRPEWADDSLFQDNGNANDAGGLNWQQQSLMARDETDPFLNLVRGENEYLRE